MKATWIQRRLHPKQSFSLFTERFDHCSKKWYFPRFVSRAGFTQITIKIDHTTSIQEAISPDSRSKPTHVTLKQVYKHSQDYPKLTLVTLIQWFRSRTEYTHFIIKMFRGDFKGFCGKYVWFTIKMVTQNFKTKGLQAELSSLVLRSKWTRATSKQRFTNHSEFVRFMIKMNSLTFEWKVYELGRIGTICNKNEVIKQLWYKGLKIEEFDCFTIKTYSCNFDTKIYKQSGVPGFTIKMHSRDY